MHALSRSRSKLGLAEDCAQDALLAIPQHLGEFRGERRFTTWVYSFASNIALVAARREGWKRVPLDQLIDNPRLDWAESGSFSLDAIASVLDLDVKDAAPARTRVGGRRHLRPTVVIP